MTLTIYNWFFIYLMNFWIGILCAILVLYVMFLFWTYLNWASTIHNIREISGRDTSDYTTYKNVIGPKWLSSPYKEMLFWANYYGIKYNVL